MFSLILLFLLPLAEAKVDSRCPTSFDALRIPHVKVKSTQDFYYCLGFHHGHDRAWQMDYFKRTALGRNAEVMGFAHMKTDLMMRLLNLPRKSLELWNTLTPERKKLLEEYASGANEGFKDGKKAPEFLDNGYEPETWTPQDSLSVLLLQSFDQTRKTFFRDYEEERAKAVWKDKTERLFDEENLPWESTILKDGEYEKGKLTNNSSQLKSSKPKLWSSFPAVFGEESGSNNWAISAKKSTSKVALFANDPHLDLKTPLFWYWIHVQGDHEEVMGASLPGVPVIPSGTNGHVAWGLTNSYINTADLAFLPESKSDQLEKIRPVVWIKFWIFKLPFFFKSFERTKEGFPILPLELDRSEKLVLKWTGFSLVHEDITPMMDFHRAKNVAQMNEVLKKVGLPAWNFTFADTEGNIGYRMVGKSYRHTEKTPFGISGNLETVDEYLTPEERPAVLNPKRNYIYSANNRHWPKDAKFYGGRGYSYSFRGYRIDELMKDDQSLTTSQNMQCDRQAIDARFFVPKFQKFFPEDFKAWDFSVTDDSHFVGPYRRLMDLLMETWKVNEYALYKLLDELDDEQIKEMKTIFARVKKDIKGRNWGELHKLNFPHLGKIPSWKFSPEISGVGDNHSVDPGTSAWNEDRKLYEQYSGASMRMIIEMKKRPVIWLSLPGLNREYSESKDSNPWSDWKSCRYVKLDF